MTGNYSNDDGGGLFAWNGSNPTIVNSMIVGNEARVTGGGVTSFGGLVTIRNTTIAGNDGPVGGGLYGWGITITSSIVWGNTGGAQIDGSPAVTYSDVQGGHAGEGNIDVDPGFIDPVAGDYRLAHGSPAIDAGDPGFDAPPGEMDVEGDPRIVGPRVDMGADELLRPGDVNRDGVVDFLDLLGTLAAWGPCAGACEADANGDGIVDFLDLLTVLANWGA
jgi:hypothetical protein